jgi:L-lysine exporter family protein LysE/ArgO
MTPTITAMINPLGQGFLLYASIIIALGPQNLFILRQGLRKQHLLVTVLFSMLADVILIAVGVGGLGTLISSSITIQMLATLVGVLFIAWCGVRSLRSACRPTSSTDDMMSPATSGCLQATIIAALGYAFLNPGKYIDTLLIVGSKSLFFPGDQRLIFAIGVVAASSFWFFALAYGASKLAPIFRSPAAWRALDVVSGCIMFMIAATMLTTLHNA